MGPALLFCRFNVLGIVVLPGVPLVPQKFGIHPLGGSVAVPLRLFDAIPVGLAGLVVSCVILGLGHVEKRVRPRLR